MKAWLKRFFEGTYVACQILIMAGVGFIVTWLVITAAMIGSAWFRSVVAPTTNNIIIAACVFFVVVFGLIWSTW